MELDGKGQVEGHWADRTVGLDGVRSDIAMMRTPDGHGRVELTKFRSPELIGAEPAIAPPKPVCSTIAMQRGASAPCDEHVPT